MTEPNDTPTPTVDQQDTGEDKSARETASAQPTAPAPVDDPEAVPAAGSPGTDLAIPGPASPSQGAPILGDLPAIPPPDEMAAMMQLANVFAAADLVPTALREKPNNVFLVLMTARDLGLSVTTALRECHVIEGKVTASPKLRAGIVRSRGLGRIWPDPENDDTEAVWYGIRTDDPQTLYKSTYTWAHAQRSVKGRSGLAGPQCQPGHHHIERLKGKNNSTYEGCRCKDNYVLHPERMLSWRALGALLDDGWSEVGTGLYSPEELGAVVDGDGRLIIDVEEVGVPEGMTAPRGQGRRRGRQEGRGGPADDGPEKISPEDLAALRERIQALPRRAQEDLAARWMAPRSEGATEPLLPVHNDKPATGLLTVKNKIVAEALVKAFERDVEAGKYGDDADLSQPDEQPDDQMGSGTEHLAPEPDPAPEPAPPAAERPAPTSWDEVTDAVRELPLQDVMKELDRLKIVAAGPPEELRVALAYAIGKAAGLPDPDIATQPEG